MTTTMRTLRRPLTGLGMVAALAWPALWNGFPIVFYDTGGYLDAAMSGLLANGRSTVYGLFLRAGISTDFWLDVLAQAAVVAWLVALTLRAHDLGDRPLLALVATLFLAVFTSLPWYVAQLMPDVWLPAGVLALYLLAFRGDALRRREKLLLGFVTAFAVAGHMGTLALMLSLLALLSLWRWQAQRRQWAGPSLRSPVLAVGAGVVLILTANLLIAGRFTFTPGGENFLFGRLVQTGIADRYAADHCPDPKLRICSFRDDIPDKGDEWLWAEESPLWRIGGWEKFAGEARLIVLDSLRDYPLQHLRWAVQGTLRQFFMVKTGDDITGWAWHTHGMLQRHAPDAFPDFRAARQQRDGFDFTAINVLHVPVAVGSMLALAMLVLWERWQRRPTPALALFLLLALVGNAAICGVLSNPHHRYQSRLAALAPLVLMVGMARIRRPLLGRKPHISAATGP